MAVFNKFQHFVTDLAEKIHQSNTDTWNIYLSNTAPNVSTNAIKTDLAEISTGNGYSGPVDTQNTGANSAGTYTVTGTAITITCVTAAMATFRYVVLYNDTPTSPVDPLIGYWDYGAALTLNPGETFTVKFNGSATTGTILTIA